MKIRKLALIPGLLLIAACEDREPLAPNAQDAGLIQAAKGGRPGKPRDDNPTVITTDLGLLPGAQDASVGTMSDNGLFVVGFSSGRAFIVTPGSDMIELSASSQVDEVNDVNNVGQVVGSRRVGVFGSVPILWHAGSQSSIDLSDTTHYLSEAFGINNSGMIVGRVVDSLYFNRATLWTVDAQGTVTELDLHDAWGTVHSVGLDINDRGQILGRTEDIVYEHFLIDCGLPVDPANCTRTLIKTGYPLPLDPPCTMRLDPQEPCYDRLAINNADPVQVSGTIWAETSVPFLWTLGGSTILLPIPEGFDGAGAIGLNDQGFVVGSGVFWRVEADGSVQTTILAADGGPADIANWAAGEMARMVGSGQSPFKIRGQKHIRALMWEVAQ